MRLQLGRPSLPLMMLLAAIFGAIFYYFDNRSAPAPETTRTAAVATPEESVPIPPTGEPPTVLTTPVAVNRPIVNRQEIPGESALFISSVGIWTDVIQAYLDGTSWDVSQLRSKVGHLEGTAWVDEPGNVVLSGHVELANGLPGIFVDLERVQVDDYIQVRSEGIWYNYIVTDVYQTTPDDLTPLMSTAVDRLTLITCDGYDFVSDSYLERTIIVAQRLE